MRNFVLLSTVALSLSASMAQASHHNASEAVYQCATYYKDSNIQETPLWNESFVVDLGETELPTKKFGVSPGGEYYAAVSRNGDEGLAAIIFDNEERTSAMALYENGTENMTVLFKASDDQTLLFTCKMK